MNSYKKGYNSEEPYKIDMSFIKNYKRALVLWLFLYVLASVVGLSLWFFLSPQIANIIMIAFTPLVIFSLVRMYLKKVKTNSPAREGVFLAGLWMVLGILTDVIVYIMIAKYMTLYEYFVAQQPYMVLWNLTAIMGGYFAGKQHK